MRLGVKALVVDVFLVALHTHTGHQTAHAPTGAELFLSIAVSVRQLPEKDGAGAGDRLQGYIGLSYSEEDDRCAQVAKEAGEVMPNYFKSSGIRETAVTDTLGKHPLSAQNAYSDGTTHVILEPLDCMVHIRMRNVTLGVVEAIAKVLTVDVPTLLTKHPNESEV